MRRIVLALFVLIVLSLAVLPVLAQEATDEAPTATVEPTLPAPVEVPVIVDTPTFLINVLEFLTGVVALVLGGFGVGAIWGHTRASKEQKDNLERAYESTSPEAQEQIRNAYEFAQAAYNRFDALARQVLQFVGEITDGEPNTDGE